MRKAIDVNLSNGRIELKYQNGNTRSLKYDKLTYRNYIKEALIKQQCSSNPNKELIAKLFCQLQSLK